MKKRNILFDLDGTLTDPGTGITRSVQHALRYYGIEETRREVLEAFIGPPLKDSFMKYYGFSPRQASEAIEKETACKVLDTGKAAKTGTGIACKTDYAIGKDQYGFVVYSLPTAA